MGAFVFILKLAHGSIIGIIFCGKYKKLKNFLETFLKLSDRQRTVR